ncbi:putative HNHc nuclease [Sphingomonas crocodyli]|uniref:DUF968 domain-containing protein n=1 Tax=Sphingomonas crocodyli TaxID=1979270 RepID=A0A437M879_9SPHN|nr:putative HNHc nuclease [Sphingomonas crocodyli]RVT93735.1 DUF968 domain-containing protein [Sphingomonas crocodyli]
MFPARIDRKSHREDVGKRSPAHRAFVRTHACCVCSSQVAIECAHVRTGTDGGMSMKPSDRWCISLCRDHHAEQHQIGEPAFEKKHGIDMKALAREFVNRSPKRSMLEQMGATADVAATDVPY